MLRKIAAYTLLFLAVPAAYILAGLKDGFTLEAFDFGASIWWDIGLVAFLVSSYLFTQLHTTTRPHRLVTGHLAFDQETGV